MTVAFMRMDAAKNPDEPWLAALVDGLVHHCEMLVLRGESYRLRGGGKEVLAAGDQR